MDAPGHGIEAGLPVRLLLLLDSRSPAGAHSHSLGVEAAVTAGLVTGLSDLTDFCRGRLATTGRVTAAFAAAACQGWQGGRDAQWWQQLDRRLSARTASPASRAASRNLGNGLRRLLLATFAGTVDESMAELGLPELIRQKWSLCPAPAPHQPLVLGTATALVGAGAETAALASALAGCTAAASAAVRLLGLDPYAVHAMVSNLAPLIESTARFAAADAARGELPALTAPALELLADVHANSEVRLFAS